MGFEGANVIFDTWVHPLMMGLEEHLLAMFREDFEFHEGAAASHLSHAGALPETGVESSATAVAQPTDTAMPAAAAQAAPAGPPTQLAPQPATRAATPSAADSPVAERPVLATGPDTIRFPNGAPTLNPPGGGGNNAAPGEASTWTTDAQKELQKIPFFVRGKARRNTERFAAERGVRTITVETLYDAKAHFGR
jgi:light-independent protochlorophyllide reductase subunit B